MVLVYLIPGRIGKWKCWFLKTGENRSTREKKNLSERGREPTTTNWAHRRRFCLVWRCDAIRKLKQRRRRRQRERQKRVRLAKQQLCTSITLEHCTTTTWNFLVSRLMEDVNTRQLFSFSSSELRFSPLEFNSNKIRQHMTNWTRWNKRREVWDSTKSIFKWRFAAVAVVVVEAPYWDVEGVFLQHVSIKVVWLFNLKLITVSLD